MGRKVSKLAAFLLILAVTICVVAVLSAATHDSPQAAADRYLEQVRTQAAQAGELSAPATGEPGISIFASLAGFFGILLIPLTGFLLFARAKRAEAKAGGRRARRTAGNVRHRV